MKKKKIILIASIIIVLCAIILIFIMQNIKKVRYSSFEDLLLKNDFKIINQYDSGEVITVGEGNSYVINNKTVDYLKDEINVSIVEMKTNEEVKEELEVYYNFYNDGSNVRKKEEKKYTSIKLVSETEYKCLIGVDNILIYINIYGENINENIYNMLIDYIKYNY